jgi:hypothetical protein
MTAASGVDLRMEDFGFLEGPRWYDPTVERWLSEDPGFPDPGLNPYEFSGDDPTSVPGPSAASGTLAYVPENFEADYTASDGYGGSDQGLGTDSDGYWASFSRSPRSCFSRRRARNNRSRI